MNTQKRSGHIQVFEDDQHFLVRIHPDLRERAKQIQGRQWDGNRRVWVYPKNPRTYAALVEEFKADSDNFTIQPPAVGPSTPMKSPFDDTLDHEFEEQILEEIRSLGDIGQGQDRIYSELERIRIVLEILKDETLNQTRTLEEVLEHQADPPSDQNLAVQPVEVPPDSLDLTKQKEIELLEKSLVFIAYCASGKKQSFLDWVSQHEPLRKPSAFVTRTHEYIKRQLMKLLGEESLRAKFGELVQRIKDEKLIYYGQEDSPPSPVNILLTLNSHRNRFGHADLIEQGEEWSRSILYLMNLAMVWPKVIIDEEESAKSMQ